MHDRNRSDYYLETHRPETGVSFTKLFGPDRLRVQFGNHTYLLGPTVFSQVNESMISTILETARQLLQPNRTGRLLDLYCGYGLFAGHLANDFAELVGIDYERTAVEGVQQNLQRVKSKQRVAGMRFVAGTITAATLPRLLPGVDSRMPEFALLYPPRKGTSPGVVQAIAARKPVRMLHVFCGIDEIPREVKSREHCDYAVDRVVPLDMFPGTPNLVLLVPAQNKQGEGG